MANYQLLKADIDAKVYQNGKQEITGENLNSVLNAMVTTLGAEYQFAGVATTATNPGTPDAKVFYIANGKGTYTNFGGLEVTEDEVVVLYWDSSWHKASTGIASQEKLTELESKTGQQFSQLSQEAEENRIHNIFLDKEYFTKNCYISENGGIEVASDNTISGSFIKVVPGKILRLNLNGFKRTLTLYNQSKEIIGIDSWFSTTEYYLVGENVEYIRVSIRNMDDSNLDHSTFLSYIMLYNQIESNAISSTYLWRSGRYVPCKTAANQLIKEIEISSDDFVLSVATRLVVRMSYANTAIGNCSLSVNGTVKELAYNGSAATELNTWIDGEVLDIYYDGSKFNAYTFSGVAQSTGNSKTKTMSQDAITKSLLDLRSSSNFKVLNNGYFNKQGYYTDSGVINYNENYLLGDLIPVVPNTSYELGHLNGNTCALFYFDDSKNFIGYDVWYSDSTTRNIPSNVRYIVVGLRNTNGLLLDTFKDYIVIKEIEGSIIWENKNVIVNDDNTYHLQNEPKRGFSGILNFPKKMYVGLRKTEETELGVITVGDKNIPAYNVVKDYNFNVIYFKDGKVDYETGWTKYEKEIPANTDVAIVFKYDDNSNVENVSSLAEIVGFSDEHIYLELPDYYTTDGYLKDKVEYIDNLIRSCATNGDIFIHISDLHWQGNQQHSPALIKYITDRIPIKRMFNTGDDFDGTAVRLSSTKYENVNVLIPFIEAFNGDYYWTVGNHDHLLGYKKTYDDLCATHHQLDDKIVFGGTTKSYYYVDNTQQKIRYIVLDAFDAGETGYTHYGPEQLSWLENTALNVESGWTILLFCHMIYYSKPSENFEFADISDPRFIALKNILVNYNGNGTIAAVFQGDAHVDRVFRLAGEGSIPVICITTDKCDGALNVNREVGTINEQAFDVVVVDKANRKITCVRIGAKAKDGVGLTTQGNDVEYREIIY